MIMMIMMMIIMMMIVGRAARYGHALIFTEKLTQI